MLAIISPNGSWEVTVPNQVDHTKKMIIRPVQIEKENKEVIQAFCLVLEGQKEPFYINARTLCAVAAQVELEEIKEELDKQKENQKL